MFLAQTGTKFSSVPDKTAISPPSVEPITSVHTNAASLVRGGGGGRGGADSTRMQRGMIPRGGSGFVQPVPPRGMRAPTPYKLAQFLKFKFCVN